MLTVAFLLCNILAFKLIKNSGTDTFANDGFIFSSKNYNPIRFRSNMNQKSEMKISFLTFLCIAHYNGIEVPSKEMGVDEIQEYVVNTVARPACEMDPAKYLVIKKLVEEGFTFFAARYDSFTIGSSPISNFPIKGDNYIARAECIHGFIDYVYVKEIYRKCGISKVLSALCMFDSRLYSVAAGNRVLSIVSRSNKEEADFLKGCVGLMGLEMVAEPFYGGFAYLSAAHLTGFRYLIVQRYDKGKDLCIDDFLKYEVANIRSDKLYDGDTGLIEKIDGSGYKAKWHFCKL